MNSSDSYLETKLQKCVNSDVIQTARYLCNLVFSEVLDPCKNTKFPGQQVVSLLRENLCLLKGIPAQHVRYSPNEIDAWFVPLDRHIPPLTDLYHDNQKRNSRDTHRNGEIKSWILDPSNVVNAIELDFGPASGPTSGLFEFWSPTPLDVSWLDFGTSDGLFRIV